MLYRIRITAELLVMKLDLIKPTNISDNETLSIPKKQIILDLLQNSILCRTKMVFLIIGAGHGSLRYSKVPPVNSGIAS